MKKVFHDTRAGVCLRGLADILILLILCLVLCFVAGEIGKFILIGLSVINGRQGDLLVLLFTIGGGILGVIQCLHYWRKLNVILKIKFQSIVVIALGSNQGDSQRIVLDAINRLQSISDLQIIKSSLWRTSPVDCPPDSPIFVNAVVGLVPRANETPESLLKKLRALEREFGRQAKKVPNEPRPLDLDLIAFGAETRDTPELILPHPRAHLRRFVLQPLGEIAPELVLQGQGKTVAELLAELPAGGTVTQLNL